MDYSEIRLAVDEAGIARITLDRPAERNALTPVMGSELSHACACLAARDDVRVVLVEGAGGAFSAGGDFSFLEGLVGCERVEGRRRMLEFYRLFLSVRDLPVPTIAVVGGHAIGAGLCLALACDLRIASSRARMGLNFTRLGLHPGMGATYLLPRIVGPARAAELLYTGRILEAAEALAIGLVGEVHDPDALAVRADALAADIAAAGPIAVRQTKRSLAAVAEPDVRLKHALEREAFCQAVDYGTADLAEGLRAARERRTARFQNR